MITVAGVLVFAAMLYLEGTHPSVDPIRLVEGVDPGWTLLALLGMAASYLAATMGFLGFVPEPIGFARAGLAQLAGSFVKLVAPGGFGGMALNTRLLLRAGIAPGPAASSVGAGQLVGLGLHLGQLAFFLWLTGYRPDPTSPADDTWLGWTIMACCAVLVLVAVALLVAPELRRWALRKIVPLTEGSLGRLRQLARHPGHLAVGVLGQLLVSITYAFTLYCCVRATGGHPKFAAVTVAFLLGNALGSVVPTPASVGGVEVATITLLSETTGQGSPNAVVLFRLITVLLPVLPGWLAFGILQRHKAL
jgi:uncharacterized protein (TIRG00374 family)